MAGGLQWNAGGRWLMLLSVGILGLLGVIYLITVGPGTVGLAAVVVAAAIALTWTLIPDSAIGRTVRRFVAAFGAVLAVLLALLAVPRLLSGDSVAGGVEDKTAACREKYNVSGVQPVGRGDHKSCSWPPLSGANEDGYCVINVQPYLPDGASMVDEDAVFWAFRGEAPRITVEWGERHTGTIKSYATFTYGTGQVLDTNGNANALPSDLSELEQEVGPGLVVVSTTGVHAPWSVTCAD